MATKKITITLPEETLARLREAAGAAGIPLSTYIAQVTEHHARIQGGLAEMQHLRVQRRGARRDGRGDRPRRESCRYRSPRGSGKLMDAVTGVVVYDTGALLAAEHNDRRFRLAHRRFLDQQRQIIVPGTRAHAGMARRSSAGDAQPDPALVHRRADHRTRPPVRRRAAREGQDHRYLDAIVVASALARDALIVTSDPDDLSLLWNAAEAGKPASILVV